MQFTRGPPLTNPTAEGLVALRNRTTVPRAPPLGLPRQHGPR